MVFIYTFPAKKTAWGRITLNKRCVSCFIALLWLTTGKYFLEKKPPHRNTLPYTKYLYWKLSCTVNMCLNTRVYVCEGDLRRFPLSVPWFVYCTLNPVLTLEMPCLLREEWTSLHCLSLMFLRKKKCVCVHSVVVAERLGDCFWNVNNS